MRLMCSSGRMRFAALVAILLSASVVDVRARRAMPTIRIIEKGVYQAETIAQRVAPKSTGFVNCVKNIRLISNTTTVFAELGVRFGLRYEVLDTTVQHAPLKLIVRFPPAGLRDPQTRQTLFESEYTDHIPRGVPLLLGVPAGKRVGNGSRLMAIRVLV